MTMVADVWGMHGDTGAGWWVLMVLGMALFWGGVIALGVWLVRGARAQPGPDPREILDRRLASGEITPDDYEQRRATLDGTAMSR